MGDEVRVEIEGVGTVVVDNDVAAAFGKALLELSDSAARRSKAGRRNRRVGAAWQREVQEVLRANGFPQAAVLQTPGTEEDRGDVGGLAGLTVECKGAKDFRPSEWLTQVGAARVRNDHRWGVVVIKRPRLGVGSAMALTTLAEFVDLYRVAGEAAPGLRGVAARKLELP